MQLVLMKVCLLLLLYKFLQQSYDSFLVTIGCNTVSVYFMSNGSLKVYDSHPTDSFGMAHPHGTCVLLEVTSVHHLTEYFKTCYRGDVLLELKGVKFTTVMQSLQPTQIMIMIGSNQMNFYQHLMQQLTNLSHLQNCLQYIFTLFVFLLLKHVPIGMIQHWMRLLKMPCFLKNLLTLEISVPVNT